MGLKLIDIKSASKRVRLSLKNDNFAEEKGLKGAAGCVSQCKGTKYFCWAKSGLGRVQRLLKQHTAVFSPISTNVNTPNTCSKTMQKLPAGPDSL